MNDNQPPAGVGRMLVRALAYLRIWVWMAKEMNPWRRPYGKRR